MLNETTVGACNLLSYHNTVTTPALIILFIASLLIFLIVGLSIVKKSRDKIMLIWIISAIFIGLVFAALLLMPTMTQSIAQFFGDLK